MSSTLGMDCECVVDPMCTTRLREHAVDSMCLLYHTIRVESNAVLPASAVEKS